jgi:hypothetical protein
MNGLDSAIFALRSPSGTTTANITPAPLTITTANAKKPFGQTITLSGFSVRGLLNGETIAQVYETSRGTVANASVAGSPYSITSNLATGGTFNPANYNINYVDGLLVVTPVIAMSIASVNAPSRDAALTEVQSQKQEELISISPGKASALLD